MKKDKKVLIHLLVITVIVIGYYLLIGQLIFESNLSQLQDWFFPVLGFIVVSYVFIFKTTRATTIESLKWKKLISIRWIVFSFSMIVLLYFLREVLVPIDPFASRAVKVNVKYNLTTDYSLVIMIAMVTIGPIWEELFFRELLINRLGNYIPIWVCMLISLLLFTSIHPHYPLFALVSGVIYIVTFLWSKSLALAILTHVLWNAYIIVENLY